MEQKDVTETSKKDTNPQTFLCGMNPIMVEGVEVTAADYSHGAWDGSPFSVVRGNIPAWLTTALHDGLVKRSEKLEYDYSVWEVRTENDAIMEAWPGDWIVNMDGYLSVVQQRVVQAFGLSGTVVEDFKPSNSQSS